MDISVIVCTYNRCELLRDALETIARSEMPKESTWEVIVVDNNSNDKTREVVETVSRCFPNRFSYLFEGRGGKSYALNTGVQKARGDILAFVDDDVAVQPTWLHNLTAKLHGNQLAGVGGRTLPGESVSFPDWLTLRGPYGLGGILAAMFDLGDEPMVLDRAPYGANMAFRKAMFDRYGGFRTDLGPSPDRSIPRPNEDTEYGRRLMAAGERILYEPAAVAHHPVPVDRIRKQYFLDWWFDYGRASSREVGRKPNVLGIPRYLISIPKMTVTVLLPTALQWLVTFDKPKKFFLQCWMWATAGQMLEMHRQRHNAVGQ
ncbi:MAG TPA: glycosyltransferase family 2 protein [Terracidiphilus sp.]|jgi:glycosyltransferase involved in cell wall biosynthesis